MPLLYYWRRDNYFRDLDMGAGYHLNQANPLLHNIDLGDSLWAFTRNHLGLYVLAAHLVIRAKTFNPQNFRYGRYRVWGDLQNSRYFKVDKQPSFEHIIRSLSIRQSGDILGRAFQGFAAVRRITVKDHELLLSASLNLELEPRARLLPEERLESTILLGDATSIERLIIMEAQGLSDARRQYLYKQAPSRNKHLVYKLRKMYKSQCQICGWNPLKEYNTELCVAHHLQWLSRGGEDKMQNLVLVCPNHHSAIHQCDAPFDFADSAFSFGSHREILQINLHLTI